MDTCLCVFAKAPVCGLVKTRLLPVLTEQQACDTHIHLIQHCLSQIQAPDWQSQLWATDTTHPYIVERAQHSVMTLHKQQGEDLGERMAFAARTSLDDYKYVVIIGTDCPNINADLISKAVTKLKSGSDVVLGPAVDGGYVLVGLSLMVESIFRDIEWGTDRVLEMTRNRLYEAGLNYHELDVQRDIDRPEDLDYLQQAHATLFHSIGVSLSLPQSDQEPG